MEHCKEPTYRTVQDYLTAIDKKDYLDDGVRPIFYSHRVAVASENGVLVSHYSIFPEDYRDERSIAIRLIDSANNSLPKMEAIRTIDRAGHLEDICTDSIKVSVELPSESAISVLVAA